MWETQSTQWHRSCPKLYTVSCSIFNQNPGPQRQSPVLCKPQSSTLTSCDSSEVQERYTSFTGKKQRRWTWSRRQIGAEHIWTLKLARACVFVEGRVEYGSREGGLEDDEWQRHYWKKVDVKLNESSRASNVVEIEIVAAGSPPLLCVKQ